jgi:hypothetical protein
MPAIPNKKTDVQEFLQTLRIKNSWVLIVTLFFITSLVLWSPNTYGQRTDDIKPIEPPFGLNWGENEENLNKWIKENDFPSTKGKTKNGRFAVEVDGPFPNAEFNRIRFYFGKRGLDEVELQFNEIGPKNDKVQEFELFTKALAIKDKIDREFGKGKLIKNERGEKDGSQWQFIHQIWTDEEHSVWLAVFLASHPNEATLSMASLHYRWEIEINEKNMQKKLDKNS